jgi:hypothetical protein
MPLRPYVLTVLTLWALSSTCLPFTLYPFGPLFNRGAQSFPELRMYLGLGTGLALHAPMLSLSPTCQSFTYRDCSLWVTLRPFSEQTAIGGMFRCFPYHAQEFFVSVFRT